jgi:hypothetical protein
MPKAREPRLAVSLLCRMRVGDDWHEIRIRNVSGRGLGALSQNPPALAQYVEVRRGPIIIVARVVWQQGCCFVLRTQDRIDILGLVEQRSPAKDREPGQRNTERRRSPRGEDCASTAERSKRFSSALQYAALGAAGLAAAIFASSVVRQAFATPLAVVSDALGDAVADAR